MTGRYDIICQYRGCTKVFQSNNLNACYCKDHRKSAKLAAIKKRLEAAKLEGRVCEKDGCNNTFTGDPRRRFCKKCAYGRRSKGVSGPRILPVSKLPTFARRPIAVNSFGQMSIAQLLKTWSKWTSGKVDFVK